MPFQTYAQLQEEIKGWLGDRTDLVAQIPTFIMLAEEMLAGDLRCRQLHERAIAILNEEFEYLPTNFVAIDHVTVSSGNGDRRRLPYRTMQQLDNQYSDSTTASSELPAAFSIIGEQIRFWPVPTPLVVPPGVDPDLEPKKCRHFEMIYWARDSALSAPNDTNNILLMYPSLYLFGSLIAAEPYLADDPRVQTWIQQYDAAITRANKMDKLDTLAALVISSPEGAV